MSDVPWFRTVGVKERGSLDKRSNILLVFSGKSEHLQIYTEETFELIQFNVYFQEFNQESKLIIVVSEHYTLYDNP